MKTGLITKGITEQTTDDDLVLINQYTRKELTKDDVYIFSLTLCDNDVDRDFERFTVESLFELEKLFVGKTGIFDHDPKASNQTARIFSCKVEAIDGKKTSTGDDYFRLTAKAYIPICDKTKDIITAIDSGITKEVSVGCAVKNVICSICKNDISSAACHHTKGNTYANELCCGEMVSPYDAYEFSFVAVPAQKNAGVIKAFCEKKTEDINMNDILKAISEKDELTLDSANLRKLRNYIGKLHKSAADGQFYKQQLTNKVLKQSAILQPEIPFDTVKSITNKLDIDELKQLSDAYENKISRLSPIKAQLTKEKDAESSDTAKNTQFTI